jgi:hypothetical protein
VAVFGSGSRNSEPAFRLVGKDTEQGNFSSAGNPEVRSNTPATVSCIDNALKKPGGVDFRYIGQWNGRTIVKNAH